MRAETVDQSDGAPMRRPVSFSFNPTPEVNQRALRDPARYLDFMKRRFDKQLGKLQDRYGEAYELRYLFGIHCGDGRLHIHGAFLPSSIKLSVLRRIRGAMKAAWGEQEGDGKRFQVRFNPKRCDEGWASYILREKAAVERIIGRRTYTIKQDVRRGAKETHNALRHLMDRSVKP